MLLIKAPVRYDNWGSGEFGAPRKNVDRRYQHKGVDYAAQAGSVVVSPINGRVSRLGYCYATAGPRAEYRLIEVIDELGAAVRFLYLRPIVEVGQKIAIGDEIGAVQDLSKIYTGIKNHCHIDVHYNGSFIDPDRYLFANCNN
jgi:murein DD-endopeptidase MepM/ murein hydrolase activator NlpD